MANKIFALGPSFLRCDFECEELLQSIFHPLSGLLTKHDIKQEDIVCDLKIDIASIDDGEDKGTSDTIYDCGSLGNPTCKIVKTGAKFKAVIGEDLILRWLEEERYFRVSFDNSNRGLPTVQEAALCLALLLEHVLAASGQLLVHGAVLNNNGRGILICGPSGNGKTTTSIALHLQGLQLLSDDAAVVFRQGEGHFMIWGLPRAMKVHKHTLNMIKELKPLMGDNWDEEGEQTILLEDLPGQTEMSRLILPLVGTVLLEKPTDTLSQFKSISETSALLGLAQDNVLKFGSGVEVSGTKRFNFLADIAKEVDTHALKVGKDPMPQVWKDLAICLRGL